MKRILAVTSLFAFAACAQEEVLGQFERADRVALEPIQVEIGGKPYEVRRNRDTFPSGRVVIRWAVIKDGQVVSCREPTVESCERALKGVERESRGGMY